MVTMIDEVSEEDKYQRIGFNYFVNVCVCIDRLNRQGLSECGPSKNRAIQHCGFAASCPFLF